MAASSGQQEAGKAGLLGGSIARKVEKCSVQMKEISGQQTTGGASRPRSAARMHAGECSCHTRLPDISILHTESQVGQQHLRDCIGCNRGLLSLPGAGAADAGIPLRGRVLWTLPCEARVAGFKPARLLAWASILVGETMTKTCHWHPGWS